MINQLPGFFCSFEMNTKKRKKKEKRRRENAQTTTSIVLHVYPQEGTLFHHFSHKFQRPRKAFRVQMQCLWEFSIQFQLSLSNFFWVWWGLGSSETSKRKVRKLRRKTFKSTSALSPSQSISFPFYPPPLTLTHFSLSLSTHFFLDNKKLF